MFKLIIITASLGQGGLENYIVGFLKSTQFHKADIMLIYEGRGNNTHLESVEKLGVQVEKISLKELGILRYLTKLHKTIKMFDAHTVIDFRSNVSAFSMLISKMIGVKKRVAMYRNAAIPSSNKFKKYINKYLLWLLVMYAATHVAGNSQSVLRFHFGFFLKIKNNFFVHNGVDLKRFSSFHEKKLVKGEAFKIIHVGRFYPQKNHATLLRIINNLASKLEISALFIGDGPLRNEVEIVAEPLLNTNVLKIIPSTNRVEYYLNDAHVFIFPSFHEGLPNALLEAMACGLPCIVSDIPEIREIWPNELSSYLVAPTNTDRFCELALQLANCPDEYEFVSKLLSKYAIENLGLNKATLNLERYIRV